MDMETNTTEKNKDWCQCKIPKNLQQDKMYEKIAEYISRLEPEECVSDKEYEKRLNDCSTCEKLAGGLTCMYCGCFVLARAKKKQQHCPKPNHAEW